MLPEPGDVVCAGLDMGLRSDSSALVIVHRRGPMMYVASITEMRPAPGAPLKPSEVVRGFAEEMIRHRAGYAVGDAHYAETVREYLLESNLSLIPGPSSPAEAYVRSRTLMRDGRVKMPRHERLLQQLREVQGKPTSGGGMSIMHPRWSSGGHGDIVAALVLALWSLGGEEVAKPVPTPGSAEWASEQRTKRAGFYAKQNEQHRSRAPGGGVDASRKHRR